MSNGSPSPDLLTLWYTQPAMDWNQAMPLGNGRLGAMVFGRVEEELIQLNEETIWAGGPVDASNSESLKVLPEVRRLLFEGRNAEATDLAKEAMLGVPCAVKPYEPLGDLTLRFDHAGEVADYRRGLNLDTATASVRYGVGEATYQRQVFASAPDQALVIRLTCDRPGGLSFSVGLVREKDAQVTAEGEDRLILRGQCDGGAGVRFESHLQVLAEGGQVTAAEDRVRVEGANAVTLLLVAATDYWRGEPAELCRHHLSAAAGKSFDELRGRHIADHQTLFRRVSLDLGGHEAASRSTDQRLAAVRAGKDDPALAALYFQFGRYLLIASSRPAPGSSAPAPGTRATGSLPASAKPRGFLVGQATGGQATSGGSGTPGATSPGTLPATLQGLWNPMFQPPWNSDFHTNINLQMNYWAAEACNLAECHLPLFDLMARLVEPGRRTAQVHYGCRGWVVHHLTDAWGFTAPADGIWGIWPMGAAWLARHPWQHYEFSRDRDFLVHRAWPLMKEAARFILDFLVEAPDNTPVAGALVTNPSHSPENRFRKADGTESMFTYAATMDLQIIRDLFLSTMHACDALFQPGEPEWAFYEELRDAYDRLPPLQISERTGRLQEWVEDYEEPEPGHRHISHLYGMMPSDEIIAGGNPRVFGAARQSLEDRLRHGGGHTGWSRAWLINLWARFCDGEQAYGNVHQLLAKSTLPNLFDDHPPFQIDGNFGGTAGIAEMLLQTRGLERRIVLLPALPQVWPAGRVTGLRARGGFTVDIAWSEGRLTEATLTAGGDGPCRISSPFPLELTCDSEAVAMDLETATADPAVQFDAILPQLNEGQRPYHYTFEAKAGRRYEVRPG